MQYFDKIPSGSICYQLGNFIRKFKHKTNECYIKNKMKFFQYHFMNIFNVDTSKCENGLLTELKRKIYTTMKLVIK